MADILLSVGPDTAKIRPTDFTKAVKEKLNGLSPKSLPKVSVGIEVSTDSIKEFKNQIKDIVKSISIDNSSMIKIDLSKLGGSTKDIKDITQAVKDLQSTSKNAKVSILDGTALRDAEAKFKSIENALLRLQKKSNTSGFTSEITKQLEVVRKAQEALYSKNGMTDTAFTEQLRSARAELSNLSRDMERAGIEGADALDKLEDGSKELNNMLAETRNILKQVTEAQQNWTAAKNGKSSSSYAELENLAKTAQSILDDPYKYGGKSGLRDTIDSLKSGWKNASSEIKGAGEATSSFLGKLKGIPGQLARLVGMQRIFSAITRGIRSMINTVIDLDSAMTQLQIVTGATDQEMTRFMSNSTQLAKNLGKSISDITSSIEVFSRLGYSLQDASELTEYATILSNVAAVDTSSATTGLTSIIKGFNMQVTDAEHVADVLIEIGQKYAVSAGEIMEAFERSGAALSATGTSFEKSAGLIAAANAAVQNASTVGKLMPSRTVMCA